VIVSRIIQALAAATPPISARVFRAGATDVNELVLTEVGADNLAQGLGVVSSLTVQVQAFGKDFAGVKRRLLTSAEVLCEAGFEVLTAPVVLYDDSEKLWNGTYAVRDVGE
jgi:hypothetical protein